MNRARCGVALLLLAADVRAQSSSQPFFMALPPNVLPYDVGANGWLSVGLQYDLLSSVRR